MNSRQSESTILADSAAVFGAASSLWEACQEAKKNFHLDFSEAYDGCDQLMREVMRVGLLFEEWACIHVAFDELGETWPYLLQDQFGAACLKRYGAESMAHFERNDCLLVAMELKLPVGLHEELAIPVDVRARNPVSDSPFHELRIQTMRHHEENDEFVAFLLGDDPFDAEFATPCFSLYGVNEQGMSEHIADRSNYGLAYELAGKLAPGIALPVRPIVWLCPNESI